VPPESVDPKFQNVSFSEADISRILEYLKDLNKKKQEEAKQAGSSFGSLGGMLGGTMGGGHDYSEAASLAGSGYGFGGSQQVPITNYGYARGGMIPFGGRNRSQFPGGENLGISLKPNKRTFKFA